MSAPCSHSEPSLNALSIATLTPASAFRRILTRLSFRATPLPDETNAYGDRRSAPVSVTTYLFFISGPLVFESSDSSTGRPILIYQINSDRALVKDVLIVQKGGNLAALAVIFVGFVHLFEVRFDLAFHRLPLIHGQQNFAGL